MTLCVLLPILFLLNATLAWIILVCAIVVTLIIFAFLAPAENTLFTRYRCWKKLEIGDARRNHCRDKDSQSRSRMEPQRSAQWDERVTEAGKSQLAFGKLANWPQTLVTPVSSSS